MAAEDDEVVVIVEDDEEVAVAVVPYPSVQSQIPSWAIFWIGSALVAILGVVLVWLPSSSLFGYLSLMTVQRQNKLWGLNDNDTIVPAGGDICRRVPGPAFCNDVVIDKDSGLAFLACDPFKPAFYPPYEIYSASRVYGEGGIWLYDTNDQNSPPIRLPFREDATPPHAFHPISLTISPIEKFPSPAEEAAEHVMRLLVVSYPENIEEGVVEVIDYHLPPASFLTNVFGIKHTERGGELSYVATIKSAYFTSPAGIVAVKDQPSLLSELDTHAIPSFYLTNTYQGSGLSRQIIEKTLNIARGDLVFYNAKAEGALRVGFGMDRPHAVSTDDAESGGRVYVSTQAGVVNLFEQFYVDSSGKQLSTVPIEDRESQIQTMMHPTLDEEIEIFHPTFMQSSHFKTNFPVVGIAALPPMPKALGGDIFIVGSPQHHRFDAALRAEIEDTVPVSILRLRPFYYVFNRSTKENDKIYTSDDPRLKSGTRHNREGTPERKRWWEATTIWTGLDFGAGAGGIAVRDTGAGVIVMGVGGGKKGGVILCSVDTGKEEVVQAEATIR